MRIKKILSQHRRDFRAIFACEHCDEETQQGGYDDGHFHQNVVPAMVCGSCGETAGADYRPLATKHADGVQV